MNFPLVKLSSCRAREVERRRDVESKYCFRQKKSMPRHSFKFLHPFRLIIAGPSQSGKTFFCKRLIAQCGNLISPPPAQIIWGYGENNGNQIKKIREASPVPITFVEGMPDLTDLQGEENTLVVLDDLMQQAGGSQLMSEMFTKMSHHRNISVILMLQNIFHQGKSMRDISVNAKYIVLFKNPRDSGQIQHLARQIYPNNPKFLIDAYHKATKRPHGYLVLDFAQNTEEKRRFFTGIFSPHEVMVGYIPLGHKP